MGMHLSKLSCALVISALAACGGGGSSTTATTNTAANVETANNEVLWTSPRGTNAGLVRAKSSSFNGIALVPDVDSSGNYQSYTVIEVVNEIDNGDGSYSGEVVVELADGSQENVIGTFFPSAGLYTRTTGDGVIFVVSGDKAINMPIGSYNYTGHAEALYSYNENQYVETGTFDMDVQFSDGTAQIMADANNVRYENNSLSINNDGDVFGVDGDYIIYDTDGTTQLETRKVDFDGTLHGSGATHVTGIAVGGATTDDNFSLMTIIGQR